MATKLIDIPSIGPVTLYKRRGNRSLRLSISSAGEVRVSLPYWLPYKTAEQFALSRRSWIEANRVPAKAMLHHGQGIGKAHRLYFEPLGAKVNTRIGNNLVRVQYPAMLGIAHAEVQSAAHKASIRALRKEAEALLPQRLRSLAQQSGLDYNEVSVKQLKSRWGSCDSQQNIILNLFLMQLPWRLIDYVLVHELTHTKVMAHGPQFWAELERHLPQGRTLRKEIRQYHPILAPRLA